MFTKILVSLDGSELAAKILPQVADLARCHGADVVLLNVYPDWGEPTSEEIKKAIEIDVNKCTSALMTAAKELEAADLKVTTECISGEAAQKIIAYADEKDMDLIAMATHGMGEVAWVLGSIAEKVVSHATVPVLLFRVLGVKKPSLKTDFLDLLDRGIP